MKRSSYVDSQGNPVDYKFESKKTILNILFVIGTIVPIILVGFIVYNIIINNKCIKVYNHVRTSAMEYFRDNDLLPKIEGENAKVNVNKLYDGYLTSDLTNQMQCTGSVKVTKYKKEYIYTLDLKNCSFCSTNKHFKGWSGKQNYKPNKTIVDVIPYYNYYERQVNSSGWSEYFIKSELNTKQKKYGVYIAKEEERMPKIPSEGNIIKIEQDQKYQYSYKDKKWLWYDIVGDYSEYSSEKPNGYAYKDEDAERVTDWSEYSLDAPVEKDYREIKTETGYIFYYEKDGKKVYANHKQYTVRDNVDENKYDKTEENTSDMYSYRDTQWRWYNGQKRNYCYPSSEKPEYCPYRDDESMTETEYSSWDDESTLNNANSSYRTEKKRYAYRFRYIYEILSDPVYDEPKTKEQFLSDVKTTVPEFAKLEKYKMEVSYKFKYLKR